MEDLQNKYRQGKLSLEELTSLRESVNHLTDDELMIGLQNIWTSEVINTADVNSDQIDNMKKIIDSKSKLNTQSYFNLRNILQIAAGILLPVFILSTLYFYKENIRMNSNEIKIFTGVGERVSITLPDATIVTLNSESKIAYYPQTFNTDKRQISFEGEGYFQVRKDSKRPFEVKSNGLNIRVLGTTFNLLARKNRENAEVALEEGSVSISSTLTGDIVQLTPSQKAILNLKNGKITVSKEQQIEDASSWKRNELVYRNVSFQILLKSLEKNYGIQIKTEYQADSLDVFTGTIPASNINEALEIIEKTYHLKAFMEGKNAKLTISK